MQSTLTQVNLTSSIQRVCWKYREHQKKQKFFIEKTQKTKKTKKNNILRLLPYLLHSQDLWKIVFLLFFWFFWFFRCFFGFLLYPFLTILQSSYRLIRFSSEKDWTNIYIRDFLRLQAFHFLWASPPCLLWPVPALWQSHRDIMKSYSAICRLVAKDIPKKTKCTCYTSVLHSIFFQV